MGAAAMSCVTDEMFAAWVSGALEPLEIERIQNHAADCATCRALTLAVFGLVPRPAAPALGAIGATIGRYRVTGPLGEGAMGIVLRGRDPVLERDVAIKIINAAAATAEQRERLLAEAKLLAAIDHPNVVRVHDAGVIDDEVFVAMELVPGATLAAWLAEASRPIAERLDVLADVGAGLGAVHAAGVVHRDIKPDNIVVRAGRGVIVDLGLARPSAVAGPAGTGIAGTPRFIAPEVSATRPATALADQFAWWTVVEDALGDTARPALAAAIARGRSPDPEQRFPSMGEAVAALRAAVAPRRRLWRVLAPGAVVLATLATVLVLRPAPHDACAPEPPASWTDARRATIAGRLAAAGVDAAKVLGALAARASQTATLRADACRAAADGSDAARARALHEELCVTDTWRKVEITFDWLAAPERAKVWFGVDNLASVLPLRRCSEGAIPALAAPPGPAVGAAVNAILDARQAIRFGTDREPRHWIPRLRALAAQAEKIGYLPATEAVHVDLSEALVDAGDVAGARAELEIALRLADQAGDDELRLWAQIFLLQNAWRAGTADTRALDAAAEATAARLGNDAITSELRAIQGQLHVSRGEFPAAATAMRDAIRLLEPVTLDANASLSNAVLLLGSAQQMLGDLRAAQASFDRAFAIVRRRFGDDALETLVVRGGRATNLNLLGDGATARAELLETERRIVASWGEDRTELVDVRGYRCDIEVTNKIAGAVATCTEALATAERVFPEGHPQLTWLLGLTGDALLRAGDYPAAIERLEQAYALPTGPPQAHAEIGAYLAMALHRVKRSPARVAQLAAAARAALADAEDPYVLDELNAELK
jgi:eukaryotic-like serine/threonine-protein kinase